MKKTFLTFIAGLIAVVCVSQSKTLSKKDSIIFKEINERRSIIIKNKALFDRHNMLENTNKYRKLA